MRYKFLNSVYSLLYVTASPFIVLRLLYRSVKNPAYRYRLGERFARVALSSDVPSIWVHAVSLGEVIAVTPLVKALIKHCPHHAIVLTTTTPTGSAKVTAAFTDDEVLHCYMPFDIGFLIDRFLKRFQISLAVMMETEIWPNTLRSCHRLNIPVIMANGRLSERSLRGYARLGGVMPYLLEHYRHIIVRDAIDQQHFQLLGAAENKLSVGGNIKFDLCLGDAVVTAGQSLRAQFLKRPVWIAASTHEGEDEQVLAAHQRILMTIPNALLILVPRHPERFNKVAALIAQQGLCGVRRSQQGVVDEGVAVYLADTLGELTVLYAAVDVAFIGGSLVPVGGHNFLEAAALHKPIISGPSLSNFSYISKEFIAAEAMLIVDDAQQLSLAVVDLLECAESRASLAKNAATIMKKNSGALRRHLDIIVDYIP